LLTGETGEVTRIDKRHARTARTARSQRCRGDRAIDAPADYQHIEFFRLEAGKV